MNLSTLVQTQIPLMVAACVLSISAAFAAPEPVAVLEFQYQQSERKWFDDGEALFGHYLGSGGGVATGALEGNVGWDLYENQSRDDVHPAHFRGFLEIGGNRLPFQIIGVYTPMGNETVLTPGGQETLRHWTLSGTIVFEDSALLGVRHALVTGSVDTGIGKVTHTVWLDDKSVQ